MSVPTLDDIKDYNPWHVGENFEVPPLKRDAYATIKNAVERRKFIVGIVGLRRIGKTVMMKQIGNELDGDRFFFSFEEDRFANYESLKFVIDTFLRMGEKPTIFLDEIGRIQGWAGLLKKYHDLGMARFVISGSSSLHITRGKESLAGRLMEYVLPPWQFNEFLKLSGFNNVEMYTLHLDRIESIYLRWKNTGVDHTGDFLRRGSFPELGGIQDDREIKKYVKNTTVEKIVFDDIPSIFPVEDKSKLYDVMCYVARESGCLFKPSHLGEALEISKDTVKKYLFYLHHSYLAELLPVEGSTIKSFRRPKKVYASCAPISYSLSDQYNEARLVETAVADKMKNCLAQGGEVFFFRDAQKHEVDFTGPLVVECKWKTTITGDDLRPLLYYMKKRNVRSSIVVGKEFEVRKYGGREIYVLPLALFLLLKPPANTSSSKPTINRNSVDC
ncbi:MAG: ATP-binding protein [Candidatus Hadarchaeales archaeon]